MGNLVVEEHALKHGLSKEQILYAWGNFVMRQNRSSPNEDQIVVIGYDRTGRPLQIIAADKPFGLLIYHAMTPPTKKILRELGLLRK